MMRVVWCFWAALLVVACDAPPVRIGFVAGLTGPYAELGVDGRDAVLLAVAEVAAKGGIHGRPVEVVVRDAGTDEVDCAAALEEVASQGVVAILGPMVSRHARVTLAAMERHPEILFFSPTMSTELLSGRDDMLVRSIAKAADQGGVLARHLHVQGAAQVVLVQDADNAEYTNDVAAAFWHTARPLGLSGQTLTYGQGDPFDAPSLAARIRALAPEAVVLVSNSLHAAAMAQELRKAGVGARLVAAKWAQTTDLIPLGGRAVEGMVLVGNDMRPSAEMSRFQDSFQQRYSRQPSFAAIWSYDAARILLDAMGRAQGLTGAAIKEAVLAVPVYQGLEREIRFDATGDAIHDYRLVVVRDGRYEPLEETP
ncbi:ABC transporter substrate-binding protein [Thermodesulfomicrobium sp. WS]|uniref:ABC transporter substrate-binding protein n=1 Tax=Thermodesulfomicrobium sp. WS TaxID=3004129 RepID=UPI002491F1D8|nr:ABC transporter substrate-binding protein [Thermodesulfomicrobium sp. WS]BDV01576.1 ABC transporter substrate-binding protein [Thermodesulfomicrobium sp. WS]